MGPWATASAWTKTAGNQGVKFALAGLNRSALTPGLTVSLSSLPGLSGSQSLPPLEPLGGEGGANQATWPIFNKLTFPATQTKCLWPPRKHLHAFQSSLPLCRARKGKPLRSSQFLNVILSGELQLGFKTDHFQSISILWPRTSHIPQKVGMLCLPAITVTTKKTF